MLAPTATQRATAAPARGLLHAPGEVPGLQHQRLLPCAALAPWVAHYWWVRWDMAKPTQVENLPHPCMHLVLESPSATLQWLGVPAQRHQRTLAGSGWVLGIKFRAGAGVAWAGSSAAGCQNRVLPAAAVLGPAACAWAAWTQATLQHADFAGAIQLAEDLLQARAASTHGPWLALRDVAERIETDTSIVSVKQVAALVGCPVRSLERQFHQWVGVSPKWVIRRYRLIEAAEQLKRQPASPMAGMAAGLGYFAQSHFVRDFKAVAGCTPASFVRRHAAPQAAWLLSHP